MNTLSVIVEWFSASLSMIAALSCGPMQIHMNRARRHCGQPLLVMILSLGVVASRGLCFTLRNEWNLAAPDYVGTIVCVILLLQYWKYHVARVRTVSPP